MGHSQTPELEVLDDDGHQGHVLQNLRGQVRVHRGLVRTTSMVWWVDLLFVPLLAHGLIAGSIFALQWSTTSHVRVCTTGGCSSERLARDLNGAGLDVYELRG